MKKMLSNITNKMAHVEKQNEVLQSKVNELSTELCNKKLKKKRFIASNEIKVQPLYKV